MLAQKAGTVRSRHKARPLRCGGTRGSANLRLRYPDMGSLQKRRDKILFRVALWAHAVAGAALLYWLLR